MSTRLLLVYEEATGEVLECVEMERAAFPDRDEMAERILSETKALRVAHGFPDEKLGFFEGGGATTESFFKWTPKFKLTDRTVRRRIPSDTPC